MRNGIIWPEAIAPFNVVLVPINYQKSERGAARGGPALRDFKAAGIDVALDDRDARPGVKFADAELIGIPHRIVIGDRDLGGREPRVSPSARDRIHGNSRWRMP